VCNLKAVSSTCDRAQALTHLSVDTWLHDQELLPVLHDHLAHLRETETFKESQLQLLQSFFPEPVVQPETAIEAPEQVSKVLHFCVDAWLHSRDLLHVTHIYSGRWFSCHNS